jgi:hypothetical protein
VKAEYYGQFYYYDERFGSSLIFGKKCLGEHQGSVRAVSHPSLTTRFFRRIWQYFSDSFRAVLLIFGQFSGSI